MSQFIRFPDLALGDLEHAVLESLWTHGPSQPSEVHSRVGMARGISMNTVASALKRLFEKGLLRREKVSHAYVYAADITRAELQRDLFDAIASQFSDGSRPTLLAAFVDIAEAEGTDTLMRLEAMIAERLARAPK